MPVPVVVNDIARREMEKARYKIGVMDLSFGDWFRCDDRFYMSVTEAIWCKLNGMPDVYIDWRTSAETVASLQGYREKMRARYGEMLNDGWFSSDRILQKNETWDRPASHRLYSTLVFGEDSFYEEEDI